MAYDERLAARISDLIRVRPGVTERRMFGGIVWMLRGNLAVGVLSRGHLLVRLPPEEVAEAVRAPHVYEFQRPGHKPMSGFAVVEPDGLSDVELAEWVERGAQRALELPPK